MPLFIQEAMNLFVGDNGPDNSKHLILETVKLPTLEETGQDYIPGGGIGEIAVGGLGLKKLESTFKIKGYDPQVMSQFGLGSRGRLPYTFYGAIRDKKGNRAIELKVIMEGRLAKIEGDDLQRSELIGHDHMIHEIWHYECYWDKKEKYYYDFLGSDWRVDGVSQNDDIRNILRIPGAS
jgi:hypothetical protein